MARSVKYIFGTEAEILVLQPADDEWYEQGFYYPEDKDYFYQILNGEFKKFGGVDDSSIGEGIRLNTKIIGGVKIIIEDGDILTIPESYDYNTSNLLVNGIINCEGQINIIL